MLASVCKAYMAFKNLSLKCWLVSQPCLCINMFTFFIHACRALMAASRRGRPIEFEYSFILGAPLPSLGKPSKKREYLRT